MEKLDETVKNLQTRWRCATAAPEVDRTSITHCGRIHPEPATPTERSRPISSACAPREHELADLDKDDWTEARGEEPEAIETWTSEIKEAGRAGFLPRPS